MKKYGYALFFMILFISFLLIRKDDAFVEFEKRDFVKRKLNDYSFNKEDINKSNNKITEEDILSLSDSGRVRFDSALESIKNFIQIVEFDHSSLLLDMILEDGVIRLYKQDPPDADGFKEIQDQINYCSEKHQMSNKEKEIFEHFALKTSRELLVPNGHTGILFFKIPFDRKKDIVVIRSIGDPDYKKLVEELKQSEGKNATGLGSGEAALRMLSRTREDWRYKHYLMMEDDSSPE